MINAASACTAEIDDINIACRQIKAQIDEKLALMRNTVGIVQCNPEFVEAGIIEVLYRELNIPLVGGTTVASAVNNGIDDMMFSIIVLTSNDVEFVVSHTKGLENDCMEAVKNSLREELEKPRKFSNDPLKMILVFPPIIDAVAGDEYIEAIESVCGRIPVFGTLSVDDSLEKFDRSASVCNDNLYRYEMTYVMLFGNVHPRFFVTTVPKLSSLSESSATITRSSGNVAYEINNMCAINYFEKIGLASSGKLKSGEVFIPLLMTLPDGEENVPHIRALIRADPDGSVVFRGKVIEGARFLFGSNTSADVLSSTFDTLVKINSEINANAVLLFSCIIRQLVIGSDSMRELAHVKDLLADNVPFLASYAGGEIAPTGIDSGGNAQNRFHNYSFIACLL